MSLALLVYFDGVGFGEPTLQAWPSSELSDEDRLEIERWTNEASALMRCGMRWRDAWAQANADEPELLEEEAPI